MLRSVLSSVPRAIPVLLLLVSMLAAPALAGEVHDDPLAHRDALLKHRVDEAARKESRTKSFLEAAAKATANQGLYDVHYYDLALDLNPSTQILTGVVAIEATVTGTSIGTLDLDMWSGMSVSGAASDGAATTFSRSGNVLTVDLDRTYTTGENVVVTVSYSGNPYNTGNPLGAAFGWSSYNGEHMIWTLSEPYGARDWWPCKDLNSDKADSVSLLVTVPDNLIVASNGLLQSDVSGGGTRTFHWKTNYPIATYLVSLAVYPYAIYTDYYTPLAGGDPMEVQHYVYPDHWTDIQANYALTVPMIEHFAQGWGEYPFVDEKYGHADFVWGGGMEHQTISSMGWWSMDIIAHELGHQWWGDMVTCDDFGHIWLNEGFATWGEAYWAEQHLGFETYQQYMDIAAYYGGGTIYVEDPQNDNIFDSNLSYNKGSWIVHMLRGVLGDADFFAGLAQYRANHLYGSATTEQLRDALEAVSGKDLDAFFQQWIYGDYFPVYEYSWTEGPGPGEIQVTVDQVQTNTGLFTMPVRLRILTDTGDVDVTVDNSLASETYTIPVAGVVSDVLLDPDKWILRRVQTTVTNASLDEGILLVNGVDWNTYGELPAAYADSAFWGANPITFWDCFSEPAGGYPANLPAPLGIGAVPAGVIAKYSTVIWVGNDYNGDLGKWAETPILSYLQAGGNVLLMGRRSRNFLDTELAAYLGVTFQETDATLGNCVAVATGLVNIPFTGTQSWNDVYLTSVAPGTTLLFQDTQAFSGARGTGAWVAPAGGGASRADGGRFAHIAGRPYRMDHAALRQNVEYILENLFLEPYNPATPVVDLPGSSAGRARLGVNYPNPFNPQTVIPFSLPRDTEVSLAVYDARGRLVRALLEAPYAAGEHTIDWNGLDQAGRAVASGSYFARMRTADGQTATRTLLLLK